MIETWFHTTDVPAAERFDYWRELAAGLCGESIIQRLGPGDFHSEVRALDIGSVGVVLEHHSPYSLVRTARHVRREDPDRCYLILLEDGAVGFEQDGRSGVRRPSDLIVHHTRSPSVTFGGTMRRSILLHFPRTLLPPVAEAMLGVVLSGRDGLGGLVAGALRELVLLGADRDEEGSRLIRITLDLLAALCHRELGTESPAATTPAAVLHQVRTFAREHLGDPDLGPVTLAAAHHISVRYLHRLFQQQNQTVAGWIRDQRLENCRRDLADPALHDRPVHAVARRWGFTDGAHFNRVFRAAFGLPPGEYRKLFLAPEVRR
ncbi:helix-turn-helix domain-containing protein [Crossiella cryophila]|uniref:AraC-like DNA-binding protein n=1 Tax=Crossiella cryophila TaxID=43355 RepID=A0A7W7FXF5_9PSEU|nr:helix-turn-helix domain-containing protein [Crossiella cryophila]MBB4680603.1 AraC-like DNA-binding protein [Crossiella cryophila]